MWAGVGAGSARGSAQEMIVARLPTECGVITRLPPDQVRGPRDPSPFPPPTKGRGNTHGVASVTLARIPGRHLPGAGVHHDAVRALIFGELGLERAGDLVVALVGQLAGLAVDLARRADGELEGQRIVRVLADEDLGVD